MKYLDGTMENILIDESLDINNFVYKNKYIKYKNKYFMKKIVKK